MVLQNIGRMGGKGNCVLAWLEYVVGRHGSCYSMPGRGRQESWRGKRAPDAKNRLVWLPRDV